ncbi:acyl-[acyl-carrier-protein] thioesterase [Clostridium sp. ZS2-4]|uniref:acyl-[acyl-carrier-protein] thioesterase n=1 Tax=Clostridium sp. ZS2-4 TaxID=2987703 RepID=UPI00227C41D0|nr:acyl-ACP thioesterase domain-containing protein [Clostridium sp. ZS2-4]MCY6354301.1 thioesterase [Clostridium sp. ZS2-4]
MSRVLTEKEYEIHFYEVNYKKKALMTSLIDYFNDVAIYQSEELGVGLDYLLERNMAWILYKWDITIKEYPKIGDKIKVRTLPYSLRKFYAYRKFYILDAEGKTIAEANSVWMLIDIKNKRPIRVNEELVKAYGLENNAGESLKIENIDKIQRIDNEILFKVRYSDIDTNGHVNNEKYAAWMIESIPKDVVLNYTLVNIKITYKKETKYGENIKVLTQRNESEDEIVFIHQIVKDEEELTLGHTVWRKNKI